MKEKKTLSAGARFRRFLFVKLPIGFVAVTVIWVALLRFGPVAVTPLMIYRTIEYWNDDTYHIHKKWVSYKKISPEMAKAVIASEDNKFDTHHGFDWQAIDKAIQHNKRGRKIHGGSTISQQTAKNVFLLPSRTYVRKAFEAYFTVLIEAIWGKQRIMEVYLNVAEMGRGVFGAEAAAEQLFDTKAIYLTKRQATLIAACLPNPNKRNAGNPSSYVSNRAHRIANLEHKLKYPKWIYHRKRNSAGSN
jgi:monofunctional biosynthetic peptidoglycan transglycosylase